MKAVALTTAANYSPCANIQDEKTKTNQKMGVCTNSTFSNSYSYCFYFQVKKQLKVDILFSIFYYININFYFILIIDIVILKKKLYQNRTCRWKMGV
jgi:hypothetical protein